MKTVVCTQNFGTEENVRQLFKVPAPLAKAIAFKQVGEKVSLQDADAAALKAAAPGAVELQ
jgi:hypothetical protein